MIAKSGKIVYTYSKLSNICGKINSSQGKINIHNSLGGDYIFIYTNVNTTILSFKYQKNQQKF